MRATSEPRAGDFREVDAVVVRLPVLPLLLEAVVVRLVVLPLLRFAEAIVVFFDFAAAETGLAA